MDDTQRAWDYVRYRRDTLLALSDWTQGADVQTKLTDQQKQAWATYRQALRDLPSTILDPACPAWPTAPVGLS